MTFRSIHSLKTVLGKLTIRTTQLYFAAPRVYFHIQCITAELHKSLHLSCLEVGVRPGGGEAGVVQSLGYTVRQRESDLAVLQHTKKSTLCY